MEKFSSLTTGDKFYIPNNEGKIDFKTSPYLIKVSPLFLTSGVSNAIKAMSSVSQNGNRLNAVVIKSKGGKYNGYYAFIKDEAPVILERNLEENC